MLQLILLSVTPLLMLFRALPLMAQTCLSMHVIDNPPAGYRTHSGELAGIHFDFLSGLEKKSGLCINKKLFPYLRARKSVQLGGHDGGILSRSPVLDPYVSYVAKLITLKTVVIPRKGINLSSYSDLQKISIARVRGAYLSDTFDNDDSLSAIVKVADYEQALKMLKKGRVDAVAGSSLGLSIMRQFNVLDDVNLAGKLVLGERELWLMLSHNSVHKDKIEQLRKAAHIILQEGVLNDSLDKYYGPDWRLANQ